MNDGGRAFPRPAFAPEGVRSEDCSGNDEQDGMTLRDYFAAKAMQAIIAKIPLCGQNATLAAELSAIVSKTHEKAEIMAEVAIGAYNYADAMLAAKELTENPAN